MMDRLCNCGVAVLCCHPEERWMLLGQFLCSYFFIFAIFLVSSLLLLFAVACK